MAEDYRGMKKNIREFTEHDLIMLPGCGWQAILAKPWIIGEAGIVFLPVQLLGLHYSQMLRFDWNEEFECMPQKEENK